MLGNESNLSLDIITYGNASKGIKPTGNFYMSRGKIFISCAGDAIWEVDESDISSSAGIKCDGDFLIEGGDIEILSTGKGGKGINVDGTLVIDNGNITVNTTGDQYVYDKNNDTAAKAIKSDGNLDVNGGNIVIRTYKKEAEGLESKSVLTISGGDIDIMAYDDCINASNHIQINGGTIFCYSETNDGIDSNGTLSISGGTIVSVGAGAPEDGFDCDNNRFSITGGLVLGIGGNSSTPTSSYCTQRSLLFNSTTQLSIINIQDASTNDNILTFKLPRSYSKLTMLFSSPGLLGSTNYNIYSGGTITGGSSFHGLYLNSNYAQGSLINSFTTGSADGSVTNLGSSNNNRPF